MFWYREQVIPERLNLSPYVPPPMNATRGIVTGLALSAVLWGAILALAWWIMG